MCTPSTVAGAQRAADLLPMTTLKLSKTSGAEDPSAGVCWVDGAGQMTERDWQPISTIPDDVKRIEGSDNGRDFVALYTRVMINGKTCWKEYDYNPNPMIYSDRPKFWKPATDYHGRDFSRDP